MHVVKSEGVSLISDDNKPVTHLGLKTYHVVLPDFFGSRSFTGSGKGAFLSNG